MSDPIHGGYREPWLRVGARGWDHPAWPGRFFPADLPEDWRLAFYGAVAQAVLVPRDVWLRAGDPVWQAWARDVPPVFRFYLELDDAQDREAAACCTAVLGGRAGGLLLLRTEGAPPISAADLLLPPGAAPLPGARCWTDPEHLATGPSPAVLLLRAAGLSLRDLRAVLEAFGRRRDRGWGQAVFIRDPGPYGGPLAELQTLVELLGLS
jgi:hypothetical protein